MDEKELWHKTRELHHACEEHQVGGAMAAGNPPAIWYAAWLKALLQIHTVIDNHIPDYMDRRERLKSDIDEMGYDIPDLDAATEYVKTLTATPNLEGGIYVLIGAHLMGGEIMRRRLENFPTKHLEWEDRKEALKVLQIYRTKGSIAEEAKACFYALLKVMDEILEKYEIKDENEALN
jgi:hypothetical protein